MRLRNPVAKYSRQFSRSAVMVDRKAAAKRGHRKHKGGSPWTSERES